MHKIIIAGAGRGLYFARMTAESGFRELCKTVAVADIVTEHHPRIREFLDNNGLRECAVCTTLDEALEKFPYEEADCVFVVTPNATHAELAEKTLAAGRHLLLEKPVAADWEDARKILRASRKTDRTIQLGFVLRYSTFYRKIRDLSRKIGHIVTVQSNERLSFDHSSAYRRGWRRHTSATGGLINEKCSHDLDIIRMIKGHEAKPVSVYSIGGQDLFPPHPEAPDRCSDCPDRKCVFRRDVEALCQSPFTMSADPAIYGQCIFKTDADVMTNQSAIILFDDGTQAIFTITLYAGNDEQRDLRILGTEGQIMADLKSGRIDLLMYRDHTHEVFDCPGGMHGDGDPAIVKDFFRCIDEGCQPEATAEDGVYASQLAFAANLSVKEKRIVLLKEFAE